MGSSFVESGRRRRQANDLRNLLLLSPQRLGLPASQRSFPSQQRARHRCRQLFGIPACWSAAARAPRFSPSVVVQLSFCRLCFVSGIHNSAMPTRRQWRERERDPSGGRAQSKPRLWDGNQPTGRADARTEPGLSLFVAATPTSPRRCSMRKKERKKERGAKRTTQTNFQHCTGDREGKKKRIAPRI